MSLKAFHLVFIALSILLAVGFGLWAIDMYRQIGGRDYLIVAPVSFLTAVALAVYGVVFVRKTKALPMI